MKQNLLKENFYKSIATAFLATGFSLSSYIGFYIKNISFGEDTHSVNLFLCISLLAIGIILLCLSAYFSLKIDIAKGIEKNDS